MRFDGLERIRIGFFVFCLICSNALVVCADDGASVIDVVIQGNQRIEDDAISRVIKTKPGDAYDEALLSEDLKAIFTMGWFDDVRVEVEKTQDGNTVIFDVKEKPTIREVLISGNTVFEDEEVIWTVSDIDLALNEGQTLSAEEISWNKLETFLTDQGWKTTSIGFTYVSKDGRNGIGYLAPIKEDYEYSGAMCIIYKSENTISCGWGPGAN